MPTPTFREKALGGFFTWPKKALNLEYKGRVVIIQEDGLIAIGERSILKASRFLNEIMATFFLLGSEFQTVREIDIGESKIDKASLEMREWSWRGNTLRGQLYNTHFTRVSIEKRPEVQKKSIEEPIKLAEKITVDSEMSDFLLFLLEAQTHLRDSAYSESMIMSWVIIERHVLWLWSNYLRGAEFPRDRRTKLTDARYWTMDFLLEALNIADQLKDEDYDEFMALKYLARRREVVKIGNTSLFVR